MGTGFPRHPVCRPSWKECGRGRRRLQELPHPDKLVTLVPPLGGGEKKPDVRGWPGRAASLRVRACSALPARVTHEVAARSRPSCLVVGQLSLVSWTRVDYRCDPNRLAANRARLNCCTALGTGNAFMRAHRQARLDDDDREKK